MQGRNPLINSRWLWLLTSLVVASFSPLTQAQVVPDATLGNGNNSITSTVGDRTDITGGLQRNSSLFHSFDQFNINTNQQVYFANPNDIRNIFSRVTGGNLSNIDGTLGVAGSANLFFINPNGIIFGPNARLDIAGSFFATTADAFTFTDGQTFAATGDRAVPLVEVNIPLGLQYGTNAPAMLTNRGNLATGQNLTLNASNLDLQGQLRAGGNLTLNATDTVRIRDTTTEPFVARSGGDMTIQGNQSIDILALNHSTITPFTSGGNFRLVSDGIISGDAHYESGGSFSILNTYGGTEDFLSLYDPIILSGGNVSFGNYTGASLQVTAAGSITTGSITINNVDPALDPDNPILTLRAGVAGTTNGGPSSAGGTSFNTTTPATTPSGITVGGTISTTLAEPFRVTLTAPGDISTRDIIATSSSLTGFAVIQLNSTEGSVVLNNARLSASNTNTTASGAGNNIYAGDIFIDAADEIRITNGSSIESNGNFGRIFLNNAQRVTIDKSSLAAINNSNVDNGGTGGQISINAPGNATTPGTITISQSSLRTPSSNSANGGSIGLSVGNGGTISLNSSLVDSSMSGTGNPGAGVTLTANDGTVTLNNNSLISTATRGTTTTANGSPIQVIANEVELNDSSALSATTAGNVPGGEIVVTAANSLTVTNSSLISTNVQSGATGTGGNITVNTNTLNLQEGGRIEARTFGSGNAGSIQLNVDINATIDGFDDASQLYSGISTDTRSTGTGGNITFNNSDTLIGSLTISNGGFLSARTSSSAAGGNIAVNIDTLDVLSGGQILTTSSGFGDAGGITVNAAGSVTVSGSRSTPPEPNSPFTNPTFTVISLDEQTALSVASPLVEESGTLPYFSLQRNPDNAPGRIYVAPAASGSASGGTGLGTGSEIDYYSFSINQDGSRAIFDVDNAASVGAPESTFVDTELFLFDALTGQLLASNDDFFPTDNDAANNAGSISSLDSRLAYNFNQAGEYVLGVARYNAIASNGNPITMASGTPLDTNSAYRLQVSLQNQGVRNFDLSDRNPNQGLNSGLFAQTTGNGLGGSIDIQAASLALTNNAEINASTVGNADGGNIAVSVTNTSGLPVSTPILQIDNGTISTGVVRSDKNSFGSGVGGDITLIANNGAIAMNNLALVSASTTGAGAGGNVLVQTTGGGSVSMTNGSRIEAQSQGEGAAGSITLNAPDIAISGSALWGGEPLYSGLYVSSENQNTAQNTALNSITINSAANPGRSLVVSDGAVLSALNRSVNPGGNITVDVANIQLLNGGQIVTTAENTGSAGNITLNTENLAIAGVSNFTGRQNVANGSGQVIEVEANDSLTGAQLIDNNFILESDPNIESSTIIPHLTISGSGNNGTTGTFDYYSFNVTAGNRAIFDIDGDANNDGSRDNANPDDFNVGAIDSELFLFDSAGNVLAQNDDFRTTAGGQGSSSDLATGGRFDSYIDYTFENPGTYYIGVARFNAEAQTGGIASSGGLLQDSNTYTLQASIDQRNTRNANQSASSGLFAQNTGVGGAAGNIVVNGLGSGQVTLNDGAQILGSTTSGQAGSVQLTGLNSLNVANSSISSSTQSGIAGNITIDATSGTNPSISLTDNSMVEAAANQLGGRAGGVTITTPNLNLTNSGIEASNVGPDAAGQGGASGGITLQELNTLTATGSQISASTTSGVAGNVSISANQSGTSSITLNNSAIAARATSSGGSAGSIDITTPNLGASNGSTIIASNVNAAEGGSVTLSNLSTLGVVDSLISSSTQSGQAGAISVNREQTPAQFVRLSGVNDFDLNGDGTIQDTEQYTEVVGGILATATTGGSAGDIDINTLDLTIDRGASVAVSSQNGAGTAGSVSVSANTIALDNGNITATTDQGGQASPANITLTDLNSLTASNNSQISASTNSGVAGSVAIDATQGANPAIRLSNSTVEATAIAGGNAGSVDIATPTLDITDGASVAVSSQNGVGTAGDVTITASRINLSNNAAISAETDAGGAGNPANINLQGLQTLDVNNSLISSSTRSGTAGSVAVEAAEQVNLSGTSSRFPDSSGNPQGGILATATAGGNAGSINITTPTLDITDGASVAVSSQNGAGAAGNVTVSANTIALDNGSITATTDRGGQTSPANITLAGLNNLTASNNSQISASTSSGTAGSVAIDATQGTNPAIRLSNSTVEATANQLGGQAGGVSITTPDLNLTNSAIATSNVGPNGAGQGGTSRDINLQGLSTLTVTEGSRIAASTQTGRAGAVLVNAGEPAVQSVQLSGTTTLVAAQATGAGGTAGNILFNTNQLTVQDQARISASNISGQTGGNVSFENLDTLQVLAGGAIEASTQDGRAGNVTVGASQSVLVNQGTLSVQATGAGASGTLTVSTPRLTLENSGQVLATTNSGGSAETGNINLRDLNRLTVDNSRISASTNSGVAGNVRIDATEGDNPSIRLDNNSTVEAAANEAGGQAGRVEINTSTLTVNDSLISSSTTTGRAGGVAIDVSGEVTLNGTTDQIRDASMQPLGGIVAAATQGGIAGNVDVTSGRLMIQNGARISVSSPQGQAGNLNVSTGDLRMDRGTLEAETGGGNGGANINLEVGPRGLLLMRNGSLISANATGSANGGNINIKAPFVIGLTFENSDIIANAVQGQGGRIDIETNAILGLEFRPRLTPLSDITASSEFGVSGSVTLNTLSTDATRGLSTPAIAFIDVSRLTTNTCAAAGTEATANSELRIIGRGGVPLSPTAPLPAQTTDSDWVSLNVTPEVPTTVTFSAGPDVALEAGQTYQLQATCVRAWKEQQRSTL